MCTPPLVGGDGGPAPESARTQGGVGEEVSREAALLSLLTGCERCVQLLGEWRERGHHVLQLEWVETDLAQARARRSDGRQWRPAVTPPQLLRTQTLSEAATRTLFSDLLCAVEACHQRGVMHRARGPPSAEA